MSDHLYQTRLRWSGGRGVAMLHGKAVPLTEPPMIGGVAVSHMDYTPEVGCYEIRRRPFDKMDDMTAAEVADADALLRRMTQGEASP